ncbi:MAG: flagellar motor protein MotB [Acidimicrobiales bacterium]|nr:flagellar motor protein MotB [Acidimicrobiales bacterium]
MPKARARKGGGGEAEGPSKAWLDSYADAITLLLAFFILLYSFSLVDKEKFIDFKLGVAVAFGKPNPTVEGGSGLLDRGNGIASLVAAPPVVTQNGDGSDGNDPEATTEFSGVSEVTQENAEQVAEELRRRIQAAGAEEFVEVANDPRGLVIRFDSTVLFRSGEAKVLPDGVIVLDTVSDILLDIDNLLVVEGHTDNVPTDGDVWPSNWELSTARSTTVLRYLVELQGLPAVRVSAGGYADTRPRASNDTEEGRAENRRVEIIVVIEAPYEQTTSTTQVDVVQEDRVAPDPVDVRDQVLDTNPDPPTAE